MNGARVEELLVCPRDEASLALGDERLVCADGHEYPFIREIPVLVVGEAEPTQPGYWSMPEQIEAALRREAETPEPTRGDVDPYVAELIVGTHGNLYRRAAHGLPRYPIPHFPLPSGNGELLLDIGCNWGRWSIAAARAGYRVIGIDPSFEAIVAAQRIAKQLGLDIDYAVADGRRLPFARGSLDVVFSYGVLQHFSKDDVRTSIAEIARVLKPGGMSWVQMPNAYGARSAFQLARRGFAAGQAFEVRYWRPRELFEAFGRIGPTRLKTDGFFTLNPQVTDLDLLPPHFRLLVRTSEALRRATGTVPRLTALADSVNVVSRRPSSAGPRAEAGRAAARSS